MMTNTPRNNQKQSDMDGDLALIEMQHIIRELEELESLLHSTDTDAAESTHFPSDHTNPSFAFEKRISELIDHIAWENESHLGLYSLVDHRDTRLTCIRIVSELNPDRKRANWSTSDYVPSSYKQYKYSIDLRKEVPADSLFDVFFKKINQHLSWSNLPVFSSSEINGFHIKYVNRGEKGEKSSDTTSPYRDSTEKSFLDSLKTDLFFLVEMLSDPEINFPEGNITILRRIAQMTSEEILQSHRSLLKDSIVLSQHTDFTKKLRTAWENYAFAVYSNYKPMDYGKWKREKQSILDESEKNILQNLSAIQDSFWEARLMPVILFLICATEARLAFDHNKRRNERSKSTLKYKKATYSQEENGRYYLLRENHYLFPKTKKLQQKQFEACVQLFVKIRELILNTLPESAIATLRSGSVHARQIDDNTLTQAKNQYFPYVVSFNTRHAVYNLLKLLDQSRQGKNSSMQNNEPLLYEQREEIEAYFICMILAECRNAHLAKLPETIEHLVPSNCINYLKALIEVTKTQNVIRFFTSNTDVFKENRAFNRSVDLLYDLLISAKSNTSSNPTDTAQLATEAQPTTDTQPTAEAQPTIKEKYLKLAQEYCIYFEDVTPYLFWGITEFSPTEHSFLNQNFPLCSLDEIILFALPEKIDLWNTVIQQQIFFLWQESISKYNPRPIIETTNYEIACTYAYELLGDFLLQSRRKNEGIPETAGTEEPYTEKSDTEETDTEETDTEETDTEEIDIKNPFVTNFSDYLFDAIETDIENPFVTNLCDYLFDVISDFMKTQPPLSVLHNATSQQMIDEIKSLFLKCFASELPKLEEKLQQLNPQYYSTYDPWMPNNKFTLAEKQEEGHFNYMSKLFFLSAKEAVLTALKKNCCNNTGEKSIKTIPGTETAMAKAFPLTKREINRWTYQTTVKLLNNVNNFAIIDSFYGFLEENLGLKFPSKTIFQRSGEDSFSDIMIASDYLEHCLSLSRDCIIQRIQELIRKHDQQFYPLRITTSNLGLAKIYYQVPGNSKTQSPHAER